jgi:hypothetical protein
VSRAWLIVLQDDDFLRNSTKVRFQILTAASMKTTGFWDVASCSLLEVYIHVRGAFCLHHRDDERPDDGGSKHL